MSRSQKQKKAAVKKTRAAKARFGRHPALPQTDTTSTTPPPPAGFDNTSDDISDDDDDDCGWDGTVDHFASETDSEDSDSEYLPSWELDLDDDTDGELEEWEDEEEMMVSLQKELDHELKQLSLLTAWEVLAERGRLATKKDWEDAEKSLQCRGVYTGQSVRSKRRHAGDAEKKEMLDTTSRIGYVDILWRARIDVADHTDLVIFWLP